MTYIIAEAGVNHNGSLEMAKKLVDVAKESGADAVKFQTFKAENIVSKKAPKADYQVETTGNNETQLQMIQKLELDEEAHAVLVEYCKKKGIDFLSTPFDIPSVGLLAKKMGVPRLKVPSGEIINAPLLLKVAQTNLPVIVSTGMATLGEIEAALGVLAFGYLGSKEQPSVRQFQNAFISEEGRRKLSEKVTILHCTTDYPAKLEEVNLNAMLTIKNAFGLPIGYSDHTVGISVAIAAVAMGATLIEKHFTLDRNLPGPDHRASLEPQELKNMVDGIRAVEKAKGSFVKGPTPAEVLNRAVVRRSLVAKAEIQVNERFSENNLDAKRPGTGVSPMLFWEYLSKSSSKAYAVDDLIED
ncbi:N-acetylneuraminate synthase [Bdellovibrio bacteriovorus]|uniref:Putative N-acetylneuraminic acid synthetase n=1 Tax=Bdellovibrio bacteriovorus (strain ATCC 15356 / DSM 50701 / NCIMB 9529 / HD100) TaxID=264462 RepID=Q6MMF1_BDEBA|nr:N-acetylneuraminate synthase [Bdellovibrio bacteriovorus]CAE79553.1 putative N-acetylneuraminic acid synthetase [Bdellovibrio bacteriovorus HD100]